MEATSRHWVISKTKIWHWSRRYMSDWSWFLPCVMAASEAGYVPGGTCVLVFFHVLPILKYTHIYTHMLLYIHSFSQYFILIFQLEVGPHGNLLTRTRKAENIGNGCFLIQYHKWIEMVCIVLHIRWLFYNSYSTHIILIYVCFWHHDGHLMLTPCMAPPLAKGLRAASARRPLVPRLCSGGCGWKGGGCRFILHSDKYVNFSGRR